PGRLRIDLVYEVLRDARETGSVVGRTLAEHSRDVFNFETSTAGSQSSHGRPPGPTPADQLRGRPSASDHLVDADHTRLQRWIAARALETGAGHGSRPRGGSSAV